MMLTPSEAKDEVYLVARVFKLGDSTIGFKLYIDSTSLRREGELVFKADKYVLDHVGVFRRCELGSQGLVRAAHTLGEETSFR